MTSEVTTAAPDQPLPEPAFSQEALDEAARLLKDALVNLKAARVGRVASNEEFDRFVNDVKLALDVVASCYAPKEE